MVTVGFLWTQGIKMTHFEPTMDSEDTENPEGMRTSLIFFVPNPYNMGVYGLPGTPIVKIWHFLS